jgi:hypothetical protein
MGKHFRAFMVLGLTAVLLSCSSGGGGNRSQPAGTSDGTGYADFLRVGTEYKIAGSSFTDNSFSLAGANLVRYVAAVSGGVACFGDLYESGTSKTVTIDVAAGEKIMVRKDAKDCKVTYTSLTFDDKEVLSDKGLTYLQDETATFKSTDRSYLQVTVKKGLTLDTVYENLKVELQGVTVDADNVETKIENAELFVATSGTAYAAPTISFDNQKVQYFNGRLYGSILCYAGEAPAGCKDNKGEVQKLSDMEVWVTNEKLDAIAPADRFRSLEAMFAPDGTIKISSDTVMTGRQLASADGSLGVIAGNFKIDEKHAFIVIRLKYAEANTYKVFLLNK